MQRLERKEPVEGRSVGASHFETNLEEDLLTLNAIAPELVEVLPELFKNAVVDSIRRGMGGHDFGLVLKSLPGIGPEHRFYVFRFLDSLYGEKARELEQAIDYRFQSEVRHLILKATSNATDRFQMVDASI